MRKIARNLILLALLPAVFSAQHPSCPGGLIYLNGGSFIRVYDPQLPVSTNNPSNTSIPAFGSGLALMPSLNGGTLCSTFYTTSNNTYHYWNGSSWVNTGHSTGSNAAVNLAGCGSKLFNLAGNTGNIYVYDGSGNGSYLTTLSGFSSGGPFDLSADCNCNFYALKTTTTGSGQHLTQYNSSGAAVTSYSLVNMPHQSGGQGLAVIGNRVYVKNGAGTGFFAGTIAGSAVTFTQVNGFSFSPDDFASCPSCSVSPQTVPATVNGGTLSCSVSSLHLVASTTVSPVVYSWSGPSIMGSSAGSVVTVNAPGVYTCIVTPQLCSVAPATLFATVLSNTSSIGFTVSPGLNVCVDANTPVVLSVSSFSLDELITWSAPAIGVISGTTDIVAPLPGTYTVSVTDTTNGCIATDVITVVENPTVSLFVSSPTLCASGHSGSHSSVTLTAAGAVSYSFITDSFFAVNSQNTSTTVATPAVNFLTAARAVVVGNKNFCADSAMVTFTILPNPAITVASGSICPGESFTLQPVGAVTYSWAGSPPMLVNATEAIISPSVTSVYSVTGTSNGCNSLAETATITVKPQPFVSVIAGSVNICRGSAGTLIAVGTAQSYSWSPAQYLNTSAGAAVVASPSVSQKYTVTGSLNGCTATSVVDVNVDIPPVVSVSLSGNAMCYQNFFGSPNSLSLTGTGAQTYSLAQGNNFVQVAANGPSFTIMPAGPPPAQVISVSATLLGQLGACVSPLSFSFLVIPNPTVKVSPPVSTVCAGEAQVLIASGADVYQWLPAAFPSTVVASSSTIVPLLSGFYSVRGSSLGCNSDIRNAVIHVNPVPQLTLQPLSSTVCAGSQVMLMAKGNAESFTWSPQSQLQSIFGQSVIAVPKTSQQFTVVGTLNSCTREAVAMVSAIPPPVVNITAQPSVVCQGARVTLHAAGASSYSWHASQSLDHLAENKVSAVLYTTSVFTVSGFSGDCASSATVEVKAVPLPNVGIVPDEGRTTICEGETLGLNATGAYSYSWNPQDIIYSNVAPDAVLVKPHETTKVIVSGSTVSLGISCMNHASLSLQVLPEIKPLVTGNFSVCTGYHTILSAYGGSSYYWMPPVGLDNALAAQVTAGPAENTTYTVNISYDGACNTQTIVNVHVLSAPEVFAGNDTTWNINDAITLTATGTGTLNWVEGENIECPACVVTKIYPERSGCYTLRAVNENGCASYDDVCIDLTGDFSLYMPNSFTPDGDGLNDRFRIFGENIGEITMEIFDRWGHVLFRTHDGESGWDGTIAGEPCPPGVYVYKLTYEDSKKKVSQRVGQVTIMR